MASERETTGSSARRVAIQGGAGALLGLIGSSLGGPAVISWWYAPPSKDAFSCAASVKTALSQFVQLQLACAAVGAVFVAVVLFFVRRAVAKRKTAAAAVNAP